MKWLMALGLTLLIPAQLVSQFWTDAGLQVEFAGQMGWLYVDPADNSLYCGGLLIENWSSPEQSFHYAVLQDGEWSLGPPMDHYAWTFANYHDTLFMAGGFNYINDQFTSSVVYRTDSEWVSAGVFSDFVNQLKVVDDELYALGAFTSIDGAPIKGLAKWTGNGWVSMGLNCNFCNAIDLVEYNGRLVVSGTLTFPGYRHIVQLVNGEWLPVGQEGIMGGLSAGGPVAVYQGDLFLGGLIHLSAGNAGHALMRWDGSAWHQVGEGLQDENNAAGQSIKVRGLLVHDDLLYVCGGFSYAGHVPAERLATWDGTQWCSVGGTYGDREIYSMIFYNDTLYTAPGGEVVIDGVPIHGVAKFTGAAYENHCSGSTSVAEPFVSPPVHLVALGTGLYVLQGTWNKGQLSLYNSTGQLVVTHSVQSGVPLDLGALPRGVYVARLPDGSSQRFVCQ